MVVVIEEIAMCYKSNIYKSISILLFYIQIN